MSTFTKRIRRHPRCINRHFSTTIFALCCLIFGEALQGRDLFAGRRISCSKPPSALSSTRSSRAINNELKIGSNNEHRPTTLETKTTQAVSKSRRTSERQRFSQKLLTMEEEQALGRKIRKAAEVKELMASVIEDKHSKQFEKTVSEGGFIEDEEGNFDSLTQLSIYSIDAEEKMKSNPSAPDMLAAVSDDPTMHVVLTESDIRDRLRIPGGRKELNKILIGGAMAREKLISSNIGLVMSIARKWCRQSAAFSGEQAMSSVYKGGWTRPSLDEAVQEGIIGLATAADRYDHERKLKFGTYATYWITNSVRNCFQRASTGCLRVPSNYHLIRQRYQQIVKVHYIESGGKPKSIDSAAAELGLTTKRLEYILKKTESLISIDAPPPKLAIQAQAGKAGADEESENYCLGNSLSCTEPTPEDRVETSFLRQCLENAMATELSPHERDILRLRHGLDDGVSRSVREVVEILGTISVSDVRKTENSAFRKLRSPYSVHTYHLLGFLDHLEPESQSNRRRTP